MMYNYVGTVCALDFVRFTGTSLLFRAAAYSGGMVQQIIPGFSFVFLLFCNNKDYGVSIVVYRRETCYQYYMSQGSTARIDTSCNLSGC